MPSSLEVINAAKIIAPYNGWGVAIYTSGAATSYDLSTIGQPQISASPNANVPGTTLVDILGNLQVGNNTVNQPSFAGGLGSWVDFSAYSTTAGAVMWVVFGPTSASVTTGNAPAIPTGTSNIVGSTVPVPIPCGTGRPYFISVNTRWVGLIGSSAGFLIAYPSSIKGAG